ncbi:metal ABC transporter solute-binding protein, Zn/Mn family [Marinicrinis sediminis]|uniref:Metal ABC transporter solute-binding protein, Zn/Mn family n=1 Tax=Marinicrinis sediminis TaxID=1652465 RepID=A0ABW5RDQ6_9BACL
MKARLKTGFVLVVMMMLVLAGCGNEKEASSSGGKLEVAASIYPMYEFASKVGGEHADVTLLVPGGVEPHDWEPAPKDLALLEKSDVLVYNGSGMEGWIDQVTGSLDNQDLILVETSHDLELLAAEEGHDHAHEEEHEEHADEHASEEEHQEDVHKEEHEEHADEHASEEEHQEDVHKEEHDEHADEHANEEEHTDEHGHDHGEFDPHVWLSPVKAIEQVRSIEAAFAEAAPEHKQAFKENAEAYIAELEKLNEQFVEALAPYKGKEFVTQHAAFAYLAHEYDLEQLPIAGLSPENEPSAERMGEIVELAREHGIQTIFFESLVSSKVAEVIAKEVGAETAVLHPLEYRTKEETDKDMDYIMLMEQNLNALKKAFEHEAGGDHE